MKLLMKCIIFCLLVFSCKSTQTTIHKNDNIIDDYIVAFGSCNKQNSENKLWKEVLKHQPNLWIWGGDNIYSDTDDMMKMQEDYKLY